MFNSPISSISSTSSYSSEYDPVTGIKVNSREAVKLRKYLEKIKKENEKSLKDMNRRLKLVEQKFKNTSIKDRHINSFHAKNIEALQKDIRALKGLPSVAKPNTQKYLKGAQRRRTDIKNKNRKIGSVNMDEFSKLFERSLNPYQKRDIDELARSMHRTL
jgi:hypothetical protein